MWRLNSKFLIVFCVHECVSSAFPQTGNHYLRCCQDFQAPWLRKLVFVAKKLLPLSYHRVHFRAWVFLVCLWDEYCSTIKTFVVVSFVSVDVCCVKKSFFLQRLQLQPAVRFHWQHHAQIELWRILLFYIKKYIKKISQLNLNIIALLTAECS